VVNERVGASLGVPEGGGWGLAPTPKPSTRAQNGVVGG